MRSTRRNRAIGFLSIQNGNEEPEESPTDDENQVRLRNSENFGICSKLLIVNPLLLFAGG